MSNLRPLAAVLLNDTRRVQGEHRHLGCYATCAGLIALLRSRGVEIVDSITDPEILHKGLALSARVCAHPLVVINGEGSMHHDQPRARTMLQLAAGALLAGRRVWLLNSEYYRMGSDSDRIVAQFHHVAIRDVVSLARAPRNAVLSADCSWLLSPAPPMKRDETLLVARGLRLPDRDNVFALAKALGLMVEFTSAFFPQPDGAVSADVAEEFARFARARLVLSSSYHGCVFAAIHGTPFLPLPSCTPKTGQFACEFYGALAPQLFDLSDQAALRDWLDAATDLSDPCEAMTRRARRNVPEAP